MSDNEKKPITIFALKLPQNPVLGGVDCDGQAIFIGFTTFDGNTVLCKMVPGRRTNCMIYNNKECIAPKANVSVRVVDSRN